jgi:hypothetical protein
MKKARRKSRKRPKLRLRRSKTKLLRRKKNLKRLLMKTKKTSTRFSGRTLGKTSSLE